MSDDAIERISTINKEQVYDDLMSRAIVLMLKDRFKDNEDITISVPVRSQGMRLLQALSSRADESLNLLVMNMP